MLYERLVSCTSVSRTVTRPDLPPIHRLMRTETRSAVENPFIPPHLVRRIHPNVSYFAFFLASPLAPSFSPFPVVRFSSFVLLEMDVVGGHNGGHPDSRVGRSFSAVTYLIQFYVPRCADLRLKIQSITEGEYAIAKRDVDQLRAELGQSPLPNLQETLEERKRELVISFPRSLVLIVFFRFMHQQIANINQTAPKPNANKRPHSSINGTAPMGPTAVTEGTTTTVEPEAAPPPQPGKRPRGRPKGSKTKKKNIEAPPKEGESIMQ